MATTRTAMKRALLGRPRASRELQNPPMPRWMAFPTVSADPLSGVAYATQEMVIVLAIAGTGALALLGPLSLSVAALLGVVALTYRQVVQAYPQGGGAFTVARANLSEGAGLVAAASLLVGSVLTIAVSVAAGVAALVALRPDLADVRVLLALGLLALITFANVRGFREMGALSMAATYGFVAAILGLVAAGLVRCGAGIGGCPQAGSADLGGVGPTEGLAVLLVLRAFAVGASLLTGLERTSNSVGTFRVPQSRNAASSLGTMAVLAATMVVGISWLAQRTGVVTAPGAARTTIADITVALAGDGISLLVVQMATAAVLVLAASTAFTDFPRLASVLGREGYLPRQFAARGDRLVFANGMLVLAGGAGLLLIAAGASVSRLIPLYVTAVCAALLLCQAGMVRHWWALRGERWQLWMALSAVGATGTAVVVLTLATTAFLGGVWAVVVAVPVLAWVLGRIREHYRTVNLELLEGVEDPAGVEPTRAVHAVILLDRVDEAAARALSYARATNPDSITALGVPLPGTDLVARWRQLAGDTPLQVLTPGDSPAAVGALRDALTAVAASHPEAFTTAIVPETLSPGWIDQLRHHRLALRVKSSLLAEGGIVVTDVTSPEGGPGPYRVEDPAEHHVLVLIAGVHRATLRAIAYARGLRPTTLTALSVNLDTEGTTALLEQWSDWGMDVPLELIDSPYRTLGPTIRAAVQRAAPDGRSRVVTCVLPEFVLPRWWQRPLHNQTALHLKGALLFERGVVTTSVPYRLTGRATAVSRDGDEDAPDDAGRDNQAAGVDDPAR